MYNPNIYNLYIIETGSYLCQKTTAKTTRKQWNFLIKVLNLFYKNKQREKILSILSIKMARMDPIIIVHGGAGDISESRVPGKHNGVKVAVKIGYEILKHGGSALDAVEKAVNSMEEDPNFNAGYGACLNTKGEVEVEASIMDGKTLKSGCCTLLHDIMYPISVARKVMDKTNHNFIGGSAAMDFAKDQGFEILPAGSLVTEDAKKGLEHFLEQTRLGKSTIFAKTELDKHEPGTVGAVAIDIHGNIAVATSTGGITGKIPGRIGDTPLLGCGTYADNEVGGVSTTGHGETIMKFNLAQRILSEMRYKGSSAQEATKLQTEAMTQRLEGTGGAITLGKNREIGIYFTSKRMSWAYISEPNELHYGINADERFSEKF